MVRSKTTYVPSGAATTACPARLAGSGVMVAIGYVRRSKESGARTVSLEDQRARVEEYCHAHAWDLGEVLSSSARTRQEQPENSHEA